MSEPRTSDQVLKEYNNLAFKAGNLQYTVFETQREITAINETLRSLALEYNKVKSAEQAEAAAKAAEPVKAADASPGAINAS